MKIGGGIVKFLGFQPVAKSGRIEYILVFVLEVVAVKDYLCSLSYCE